MIAHRLLGVAVLFGGLRLLCRNLGLRLGLGKCDLQLLQLLDACLHRDIVLHVGDDLAFADIVEAFHAQLLYPDLADRIDRRELADHNAICGDPAAIGESCCENDKDGRKQDQVAAQGTAAIGLAEFTADVGHFRDDTRFFRFLKPHSPALTG